MTHSLCLYLINTIEHNRFWWANIFLVSLESPCSLYKTKRHYHIHICWLLCRRLVKDCGTKFLKTFVLCTTHAWFHHHHHHHHHKHQGLDPLIRSVSNVTTSLSNVIWSSNCSPSLWSVVVWFQRDSVLWREVTKTSGRPHPLWPQDKRLHTPRTTDYRHTRQDRWIQTELVPTLA